MCARCIKQHNIDCMCSADPMQFNVGPASATSDQYCISIGSTHRGCWVDLKPCWITILMVTEDHPSLSSSAVRCCVQIILTSEIKSAIEARFISHCWPISMQYVSGGEFLRPIVPTIFGDGCQLLVHILNEVIDG